jgi:hypothetical protein
MKIRTTVPVEFTVSYDKARHGIDSESISDIFHSRHVSQSWSPLLVPARKIYEDCHIQHVLQNI